MKQEFTILIADRNPHVRIRAFQGEPLDLIILDPDLPDADEAHVLEHLLDRIPVLPVVVHNYPPEHGSDSKDMKDVIFVEKRGSSVSA